MLHVVDAGPNIHQGLELGMLCHVLDLLPIHVHQSTILDGVAILLTRSDHYSLRFDSK